ncbi:hypothetical protein [Bittarella sp. HCP28S3_D9]|uniref:hypothetical protein n=1 Tax=Bittarella sp. HCP28S3_D9 TaxID=3440253 RepID=UPI003F88E311
MKKALVFILLGVMIFYFTGCQNGNIGDMGNSSSPGENSGSESTEITWNEILADGVDEEKLMEAVDTAVLERVAALLQELTGEIEKREREDPEFAFGAGWYTYTLESEQFQEVLEMGNAAAKPLYLILYKSPHQGLYEYICCMALERITKVEIEDWESAKDFIEQFGSKILEKS